MNFDEINSLEEYFAPMEISDDAKKQRIELAELLTDVVLLFFSAFRVFAEHEEVKGKEKYFQDYLFGKFEDAVLEVTGIDDYLSNHLRQLSKEVVNTTYKNVDIESLSSNPSDYYNPPEDESSYLQQSSPPIQNQSSTTKGDSSVLSEEIGIDENIQVLSYWLSTRRAFLIAGNEANSILNYSDYVSAKSNGNVQKQWMTMEDEKVRMSHAEINGQIIGIDDLFVVGDSVMRFPHDEEYGASPQEIIGCRCTVRYF